MSVNTSRLSSHVFYFHRVRLLPFEFPQELLLPFERISRAHFGRHFEVLVIANDGL